jgi:hypothetical protein
MCAVYDSKSRMHYTRECSPVYNRTQTSFTSDDLKGDDYIGVCPYFANCGLSKSGTCSGDDLRCRRIIRNPNFFFTNVHADLHLWDASVEL